MKSNRYYVIIILNDLINFGFYVITNSPKRHQLNNLYIIYYHYPKLAFYQITQYYLLRNALL